MEIKIEGLTKVYPGEKYALRDLHLTVGKGLFGLLGPNGAGKTTLMRVLVTLMNPTAGQVTINGHDLQKERAAIRAVTGYLPQGFSTFPKMKTWEFLDYSARLSGFYSRGRRQSLVEELLEKVGLFDFRERQASKLSGGMKRRLGIAQALVGNPVILIVDEPTSGLDPEERIRFRNILTEMARENRIIILSTHIVGDISSTCNDMALLVEGQLAFNGPPSALIDLARNHTFRINASDSQLAALREQYAVISTIPDQKGWQVQVVADRLNGIEGAVIEPDLEHAYVYFMEYYQKAGQIAPPAENY